MPVKTLELGKLQTHEERHKKLREKLVKEWRNQDSEAEEPLILEQKRQGKVVHVYVVWDEWPDVDHQDRSEIVTDAFVEVKGDAAITNLAVAMGVTKTEAVRMGLVGDEE